ncbi:protein of unknown function [Azospirillum lipoferum 4B]|uniref:Uncharacterized protein n=1 Tax=Azospirillum lipoferum (strain 4B) TaxID=862719 RepID=G7Z212_AZOL4|nr:protein of unknown function [Azospirillum lipoferum 4B]
MRGMRCVPWPRILAVRPPHPNPLPGGERGSVRAFPLPGRERDKVQGTGSPFFRHAHVPM